MADESFWINKAQTAEAELATLRGNIDRIKEKHREIMSLLGAKEKSDGSVDIDFEVLVERLGVESCLSLRAEIDRKYRVSGEPGEKPRIRLVSG